MSPANPIKMVPSLAPGEFAGDTIKRPSPAKTTTMADAHSTFGSLKRVPRGVKSRCRYRFFVLTFPASFSLDLGDATGSWIFSDSDGAELRYFFALAWRYVSALLNLAWHSTQTTSSSHTIGVSSLPMAVPQLTHLSTGSVIIRFLASVPPALTPSVLRSVGYNPIERYADHFLW